jgi:hypothetical protein
MIRHAIATIGIALAATGAPTPGAPGSPRVTPAAEHSAAASARRAGKTTCTNYPCPAGYFWYHFTDSGCPSSPDTFEAYIEYWNSDNSFAYDVYAGHATYWCGAVYNGETVSASGDYQDCLANSPWNCPDLGYTWSSHP